jgi:hypothetical protein
MTPILRLALLLSLAATTAATTATAAPSTSQTLFFDAVYTHASTAGPAANKIGHVQLASGVLHDARGRSVGRFTFTCRWIQILANNDAREDCTGWLQTRDGHLAAAGPARRNDATHHWTTTAASGAYRGAEGSAIARDLGKTESLLTVTISARPDVTLRAGALALSPADIAFRRRANTLSPPQPTTSPRYHASRSRTSTPPTPTQTSSPRSDASSPAQAIHAPSSAPSKRT